MYIMGTSRLGPSCQSKRSTESRPVILHNVSPKNVGATQYIRSNSKVSQARHATKTVMTETQKAVMTETQKPMKIINNINYNELTSHLQHI